MGDETGQAWAGLLTVQSTEDLCFILQRQGAIEVKQGVPRSEMCP